MTCILLVEKYWIKMIEWSLLCGLLPSLARSLEGGICITVIDKNSIRLMSSLLGTQKIFSWIYCYVFECNIYVLMEVNEIETR